MSYLTQDSIASSPSMQHRVAQCYAGEQPSTPVPQDPDRWSFTNRRYWAAAPDWDAAWEYALNVHGSEEGYDPGPDEAVITDGQILAQVQSMLP
jgi:hypothetical protein